MYQYIIDDIWIGDWQDAEYNSNKFSYIMTVAKDSPFVGNSYFGMIDGHYPENERLLREAIAKLYDVRKNIKGKILVHCIGGFSRSTSVIAGYMIRKGYSADDALGYIKNIRPLANPVYDLVILIRKYEIDMIKGR